MSGEGEEFGERVSFRGGWDPRRRIREAVVMIEIPCPELKDEWAKAQNSS